MIYDDMKMDFVCLSVVFRLFLGHFGFDDFGWLVSVDVQGSIHPFHWKGRRSWALETGLEEKTHETHGHSQSALP